MARLRVPAVLRPLVGGERSVPVEAATLADLRRALAERYPDLAARVVRDGAFSDFAAVFVDGVDVRYIAPDDDISTARSIEIIPAVSGGAVAAQVPRRMRAAAHAVYGSFVDETIALVANAPRDTISFAVGSPAPEAIALAGAAELAQVVMAEGPSALGYGITEGDPELREIVAASARERGVDARAEDTIVTAGALQAVDLACRTLLRPGDVVVMESPGFANAIAAFRNHGARILEVPVDAEGLDVAAAARLLRTEGLRPRLFFVNPTFQNPTGATLSRARRAALVHMARSHDAVILEDDPYVELRFRGPALPPLASLDRAGVISIGSFSKTFLPGIRVGWAIADPATIKRMAAAKQTMDSSTSMLGQRLVVAFHRRGTTLQHLGALRALYAERQERAVRALEREFAGTPVSYDRPEGGFYLWLRLGGSLSARTLLAHALEEGVAFVPGDAFTLEQDGSRALRFSYSSPTPERIDEGVRRLRRALDRLA